MKKTIYYALVICLLFACTSCATVFKGTTQTIHVTSEPPGATIEVNGVPQGTTPADITLKKSMKGEPVVLKKSGYEDKTFTPSVAFDTIGILNIFAIVGFGVDYLTGAMMQYAPLTYSIPLTPLKK